LTPKIQKPSESADTSGRQNLPADLADVVAAWPELPEHIKAAIKALVQTHIQGVQK